METIKFIYPVFGHIIDPDDYECDISAKVLVYHKELLNNKIKEFQDYTCCGQSMGQFFDENADVKSKLISAEWSFEEFGGKLYGVTIVELTDAIDKKGIADLKDWISGQNSDGLGECFEQKIFYVDEHFEKHIFDPDEYRLSVSLWGPTDYFICTEEEFLKNVEQVPKREKPTCKLIGEDGNIFNLMGIARRTLIQNGKEEEADEMCAKIKHCKSYDEALVMIDEYVTIV